MKTPVELKYSKTHEWVRFISDTEAEVGLTDYAQNALGDLVFVNLPEVDAEAVKNPHADIGMLLQVVHDPPQGLPHQFIVPVRGK